MKGDVAAELIEVHKIEMERGDDKRERRKGSGERGGRTCVGQEEE